MKLKEAHVLKLENFLLKEEVMKSRLNVLQSQFNEMNEQLKSASNKTGDYIKLVSGKEYKEGVPPSIDLENKTITFGEK